MKGKILYLAFRFPIPATDGYKLRVYNYCKMLKKIGYKVDLFFIDGKEGYENYKASLKESKKIFNNVYFYRHSRSRKVANAFKSIFMGKSLQEKHYISPNAKKIIEKIHEKNKYDKVISSYIRMFKYMEGLGDTEKIIDYTDSISYHYLDAKEKAKGIWKWIYIYEYSKVKKYEKYILEKVDKAYITSPEDRNFILGNQESKIPFEVLPQGVSEDILNYPTEGIEKENIISFIGQMSYYPNIDAVNYFCKEILPNIDYDGKFYIIGKNPPDKIKELSKKNSNIVVTGFVDDPYELISKSKLMVAPMRLGGGIQNKVLEGMALGKTVLTMEKVKNPILGCENNKHILSVKNTEEYILKLNSILSNSDKKLLDIGKNAKDLMNNNYNWELIEKKFKGFLLGEKK